MRNRPIMTGALMRPSLFNRPLPRLKPQPIHISRMIWNRRRVRDLRLQKQELWTSWRDDLQRESTFEANLFREVQQNGVWFERVFEYDKEWSVLVFLSFGSSKKIDTQQVHLSTKPWILLQHRIDLTKHARGLRIPVNCFVW